MDFSFTGLGGTDEVGASSYLYHFTEGRLLIDAGLRPGMIGDAALPQLDVLNDAPPGAVILTHAHLDHVSALPVVLRRYPKLHIYCTPATAHLAALTLADSLRIMEAQGQMLYSPEDMKRTFEAFRPVEYFQRIADHGFAFTLYPSGHLLGAASVLIESSAGTVFHTGDVSNVSTPVVDAAWMPPRKTHAVDAVVSEATYGDTLLPARKIQVQAFMHGVAQVVEGGGRVLIPSFALGRAQEIVQLLHGGMVSGIIPEVPLYLDGMVRTVTEAYQDMLPLLPQALRNRVKTSQQPAFFTGTVEAVQSAKDRERIQRSDKPAVVIASSGMLHAGASPSYARAWLPDSGNALFVVGYQDGESPGRRLLELQQGGEVLLPDQNGFSAVSAYARIERFYLSAHSDQGGLLSMIARYDPKKVLLTHGEAAPRRALAGFLKTRDVALPAAGEMVSLRAQPKRKVEFIPPATPQQPRKQRHRRVKVDMNYDADHHVLVVQLPDNIPGNLFGDGEYTLEVLRGKLTKVQLTQRMTE
ncbi:beta-lactamase domain protein (plasmid) [Deinococcus proteolyticus MRP]|uniref:Beta-lactamase domain protein n=1 Tax=Deinococcus proteolyticus (strain ATCC 35074 / DSM 20540 / JCM 6276 / NBRC 101906 / NCIMB 13154 / VKM Ac-1939 / CCM 2703 / MRP) TaxID=693977 RepID=F0RQK0_DEIPM|nr:MBL fold metallo-hydrolase [Deinococcus proteolyticus]ADY27559.1 beta-lactamase domain protein [Deinococcus proteolyticus MRP]